MIAAPEAGGDIHLEVLSRLSTLLMDETFREQLIAAMSKKPFWISLIKKKRSVFWRRTEEREGGTVSEDAGSVKGKTAGQMQ